jgi:lysophospholipase L1-like esterase
MLFDPENGETVCFAGDSITHGGLYHKILSDAWTLRRPDRRVRWINCGISGDSAGGAVGRFDWDIAPHHPTRAFVLFGMNDGNRGLYDRKVAETAGNADARSGAIKWHKENMAALVDRLRAGGTRDIILLSPTVYDQYTRLEKGDDLPGYDDALAEMGEAAQTLARKTGCGFVDLHAAFVAAVKEEAGQGKSTYVSEDRVHPPPVGHLLMAAVILRELELPALTRLDLHAEGGLREWTVVEQGLPCVAPAEAWAAAPDSLRAAWRDLNREIVSIRGLPRGRHELRVDGKIVVSAEASEWEAGVDLAAVEGAPQVQHAAEVCRLTALRHQHVVSCIRNPAAARMFLKWESDDYRRRGVPLSEDEEEAARQRIASGEGNPYILGLYRDLLEHGGNTRRAANESRLVEIEESIRAALVIPSRRYEVL